MSQVEILGRGSIKSILGIVQKIHAENILLVTGRESYKESGAKREIEDQLEGRVVHHFDNFSCDPKLEDVHSGVEIIKQTKYDWPGPKR